MTELSRMRRLATGLLVLMAALFLAARAFETHYPALGYLRAFAEAAMIGGLADWFAVTALFRRPLGLPIPHTAVIPNSKDRIAAGLGAFLADNFLQPDDIARHLDAQDRAQAAAHWLARPGRRRVIAQTFAAALPRLLALIGDAQIARPLGAALRRQLLALDLPSLLGGALDLMLKEGRQEALVNAVVQRAYALLAEQEPTLRARITRRTGWLWRTLGADDQAADAVLAALRDELGAIVYDPDHSARRHVREFLAQLADDLRHDAGIRADVARFQQSLIDHPAAAGIAADLWDGIKRWLSGGTAQDHSDLVALIENALGGLSEALTANAALRETLNSHLRQWAQRLAARHGGDIAELVAGTVRGWDARSIVERLETSVGRDLQFIRINGTLVGGLVGLALHALTRLLG
ncbi:DUF445 domain-containing protein [Hankyongella ginsenosidimutans]|uniref:DUF445 domain-containing protein n=1 Tax=Hankyongella ginsenosidimutans TaxID=1763828 RepID=A0A4D7CBB8_9SPHN|nr:DUF445 domain-containing protein [Hankyongella ginsenosidimutans]QCI79316.1 DUF445 domain-containing protein [Hankyongella ginsenosidimutans]TXG82812.1 MAG: DUF445 domain-containing protein [Sphingomonadales bacterium]